MEVLKQQQLSAEESSDKYSSILRKDVVGEKEEGEKRQSKQYFRAASSRFKNRGAMVIISDILQAAKSPTLKTSLMYQTQSSYAMITTYLKFLLERGLMKTIQGPDGAQFYKTTDFGLEFLEQFHSLIELFTSTKVAYKRAFSGPYEFLSLESGSSSLSQVT
jgi:predicted transcriptional regulator